MFKLFALAATVVAVALAFPNQTLGHFGGEAYILVQADHVNPGEPFEVVVADLTPGSSVVIEARRAGESVEVGRTVSDTEGHFTTTATLPTGYANGYTELVATAQDGTQVSTYVLVGPRDATTGPPPSAAGGGGIDPSLIVLGVLVGGSIGAAGYLMVRRGQSSATTAPAAATQRRAVARKRPRRRST